MPKNKAQHNHNILLVTGFSGAGKSSALKVLEDMGYDVIDNLPMDQVENILEEIKTLPEKLAFGLDSRTHGFSASKLLKLKKHLQKQEQRPVRLLYLFCEKDTLIRRYSETRRKHPMAKDEGYVAGIEKEDEILGDIPHFADILIDTTTTNANDLRELLQNKIGDGVENTMSIQLVSFGYKNGLPSDADMVIDVRFLKNPHWDTALKQKSGKDSEVGKYIEDDPEFEPFFTKLSELLDLVVPAHQKAGKSYFTLALGCTGGKHRSVFVVEKLASMLKGRDLVVSLQHRDLGLE